MNLSDLKEKEAYTSYIERPDGTIYKSWNYYYSIYSLINTENGKRYIGRTINPLSRIRTHLCGIKTKHHHNLLINADANCEFDFEILADHIADRNAAKELERTYMLLYKTYDDNFGYNGNDRMVHKLKEGGNKCAER